MSCQAFNNLLSTFKTHTPKLQQRIAYEVTESDRFIYRENSDFVTLITANGGIDFYRDSDFASYFILPGDFIEIIKWPSVAVHWTREVFLAMNVTANDTVIERGEAVLEKDSSGDLHVAGYVIEISGRYFTGIEKGRVMTAWSIEGATKFRRHHDSKKLEKTLAELAARKKKAQVLEVGYWTREFAEVQGGAV